MIKLNEIRSIPRSLVFKLPEYFGKRSVGELKRKMKGFLGRESLGQLAGDIPLEEPGRL